MGNSNPKRDLEEGLVLGRNAVIELLKGPREVECIYICDDVPARGQPISRIVALAKEARVPVKRVDVRRLDTLANGLNHQGVAAQAAAFHYCTVEELFARAAARGEPPLLVIADSIEDPHNLGAIIRTAEAAGAHGLIIPKRGGARGVPPRPVRPTCRVGRRLRAAYLVTLKL